MKVVTTDPTYFMQSAASNPKSRTTIPEFKGHQLK